MAERKYADKLEPARSWLCHITVEFFDPRECRTGVTKKTYSAISSYCGVVCLKPTKQSDVEHRTRGASPVVQVITVSGIAHEPLTENTMVGADVIFQKATRAHPSLQCNGAVVF